MCWENDTRASGGHDGERKMSQPVSTLGANVKELQPCHETNLFRRSWLKARGCDTDPELFFLSFSLYRQIQRLRDFEGAKCEEYHRHRAWKPAMLGAGLHVVSVSLLLLLFLRNLLVSLQPHSSSVPADGRAGVDPSPVPGLQPDRPVLS